MPQPAHISLFSPDRRVEICFALGEWCADPSTSCRGADRCCPDAPLWQVWFAGRQMLRWSRVGTFQSFRGTADGRQNSEKSAEQGSQSSPRQFAMPRCNQNGVRSSATPACNIHTSFVDKTPDEVPDKEAVGFEMVKIVRHRRRQTWLPASGDSALLEDHANELVVRLRERAAPSRRFDLIFRCSNQGAAMRMRVPRQRGLARVTTTGEGTVFSFPEETRAWLAADGFRKVAMEGIAAVCDTPLTLNYVHGKLACLLQVGRSQTGRARPPDAPYAAAASGLAAALRPCGGSGGPALPDSTAGRCFANAECALTLQPTRAGLAELPDETPGEVATPCESPWQVLLVGDSPCGLLQNSGLILNLGASGVVTPEVGDAVSNCTMPFAYYPLWQAGRARSPLRAESRRRGDSPPYLAGNDATSFEPPTPAHRLAFDLVCGVGAARWDETRFLRGEIGEFVVVARRLGTTWQVGGITGADGRVLTVRLEEVLADRSESADPADRRYELTILRDPLPNETAEGGIVRETFHGVDAFDKPRLELPPHGGFLLRLEPES